MKKRKVIVIVILCIVLFNMLFITKAKAVDEETNNNEEVVQQEAVSEIGGSEDTGNQIVGIDELGNASNTNKTVSLKAKVVEAGEVYVEEVSTYKIKYQDLKVQIKEGEFKGQIFPAKYTVSYDLQGKIEGYPLNKGKPR